MYECKKMDKVWRQRQTDMRWEYEKVIIDLVENNKEIIINQRERSIGVLMHLTMKQLRGKVNGGVVNEVLEKQIGFKLKNIDKARISKAFNWWEDQMFNYVYHDGSPICLDIPYENELHFIGEHFQKYGARWCINCQQWEFGWCII